MCLNVHQDLHWITRAQLWRFIFLQREDGSWAPARLRRLPCRTRRPQSSRHPALSLQGEGLAGALLVQEPSEGEAGVAAFARNLSKLKQQKGFEHGDPLAHSNSALLASVPTALVELAASAEAAGRGSVDVPRLWATMLSVAVLEKMSISCVPNLFSLHNIFRIECCVSRCITTNNHSPTRLQPGGWLMKRTSTQLWTKA